VALEAAYGWVADLLGDLGLEPHLAHSASCKAIASARLKNDKVDARTLAHLLRAELLPEAWIAHETSESFATSSATGRRWCGSRRHLRTASMQSSPSTASPSTRLIAACGAHQGAWFSDDLDVGGRRARPSATTCCEMCSHDPALGEGLRAGRARQGNLRPPLRSGRSSE
jgi:hypothetical protein